MATWNGVITNAGNSLLNEWVNEKTLNFDSAAAGQGTVAAAAMMAQTALVNEKQTASLLGGERVSSGIRLKLRIAAPNTAYTLNQFRVSASVDGGASAMIALFQLEQGVPIPSKTESPDFVYTFYALISCSNTGTWTMTVDTSACVTQSDMSAAITEAVKTKQDKIMVKGLLLGDGNGNISAAVAGKDYGYPLATGSGAPTDTTEGTAGQHYYDSATGKEYVCSGKDSSGKYQWKLSGASDAADLTYNGESLDTFLDGVSGDLDTLSKGLDGSKPLTGTTDPTSSTKGSVGQSYLNTDTMQTFYCTAANDQTGVYTWEKPKGGGVAPQLEVSVATGSAITCTNGETTLTGTSVGGKCVFDLPGYGAWSLYATLNGQTTATETVVVDQVKQAVQAVDLGGSGLAELPRPAVLDESLTKGVLVTIEVVIGFFDLGVLFGGRLEAGAVDKLGHHHFAFLLVFSHPVLYTEGEGSFPAPPRAGVRSLGVRPAGACC